MINDNLSIASVEERLNKKNNLFMKKIINKIKENFNDDKLKEEILFPIYNEIYTCILPHYIIFITLFIIILVLLIFIIIINFNLINKIS